VDGHVALGVEEGDILAEDAELLGEHHAHLPGDDDVLRVLDVRDAGADLHQEQPGPRDWDARHTAERQADGVGPAVDHHDLAVDVDAADERDVGLNVKVEAVPVLLVSDLHRLQGGHAPEPDVVHLDCDVLEYEPVLIDLDPWVCGGAEHDDRFERLEVEFVAAVDLPRLRRRIRRLDPPEAGVHGGEGQRFDGERPGDPEIPLLEPTLGGGADDPRGGGVAQRGIEPELRVALPDLNADPAGHLELALVAVVLEDGPARRAGGDDDRPEIDVRVEGPVELLQGAVLDHQAGVGGRAELDV